METQIDQSNFPSQNENEPLPTSTFRGEILYSKHKELKQTREEIQKQGEIQKLQKELAKCTFHPCISKPEIKTTTEAKIHNKSSFDSYVDRMKKLRDLNKEITKNKKTSVGSGNVWRKSITIPKEFYFRTHQLSQRQSRYERGISDSMDLKATISSLSPSKADFTMVRIYIPNLY